MSVIKIWQTIQPDFRQNWKSLLGKLSLDGVILEQRDRLEIVRQIIARVRAEGDPAVSDLTARHDKVTLTPEQFRIPPEQLQQAHEALEPSLLEAVRASIANVRAYQKAIKVQPPADPDKDGVRLGLRQYPMGRVGVCIPGASAPLVSTVIMTAVPALVAGVREIAVISSPSYEGSIHPAILGVCHEIGINEVYRISGAQGVAALGLGTQTIQRVDKIVGPSSWWGQMAKRELYGLVDIDSVAGPSEVLIVADTSARADWVAADMLSQAEHDPGSAILLTDSTELADAVVDQIELQLNALSRAQGTRRCIEQFSAIIVTRDMSEAGDLCNEFAPEHLQVITADADAFSQRLVTAGAVFLGPHTPVAVGDYYAGPSHTLPTGTSARFFGPLSVNDFFKYSSVTRYDANALKQAAGHIGTLADAEGLDAHHKSVDIRLRWE